MQEADVRREIYHSLQGYNYWPIHGRDAIICPHCGSKVLPAVAGRPDLIVLDPVGSTKVAEVKVVDLEKSLSYSFNQIEDDQRRWMDAWHAHDGLGYLAIGTLNEKPRRIWVIPWAVWCAVEVLESEAGRNYMPVDLALYRKLPDKNIVASLESQFSDYKMIRYTTPKVQDDKFSGGYWDFPAGHSMIEGKVSVWQTRSRDGS